MILVRELRFLKLHSEAKIMKSNLKEKEIPYFHHLTSYISDFCFVLFVCVCLQCSVAYRIVNQGLNPGHNRESTES